MLTLSVLIGIVNLSAMVGHEIIYNLPKPTLTKNPPYGVFLNGESINLTCRCVCRITKHRYYRDHVELKSVNPLEEHCETNVSFNASLNDEGNYTCQCFREGSVPLEASPLSDPVRLLTTDEPLKPEISTAPASGAVSVGEKVEIFCKGDKRSNGGKFFFYKDRAEMPVHSRNVSGNEWSAAFTINSLNRSYAGKYSCQYQTTILGRLMNSSSSKDVTIAVKEQYPTVALVRLCLSALVLIAMVIIIVDHFVNALALEDERVMVKSGSRSLHNRQNRVAMSFE